jgi:hypothetical protein
MARTDPFAKWRDNDAEIAKRAAIAQTPVTYGHQPRKKTVKTAKSDPGFWRKSRGTDAGILSFFVVTGFLLFVLVVSSLLAFIPIIGWFLVAVVWLSVIGVWISTMAKSFGYLKTPKEIADEKFAELKSNYTPRET